MNLCRFSSDVGKNIDACNSTGFILSRITHLVDEAMISCAYLEANGVIGCHQAFTSQLFCVVGGKGWVRGDDSERISIEAGQAAYWDEGEWHESGTNIGMTAIIIESEKIDLSKLTPTV